MVGTRLQPKWTSTVKKMDLLDGKIIVWRKYFFWNKYIYTKNYSRFETSAKDNINIDKAAKFLVSKILENDTSRNTDDHQENSKIDLNKPPPSDKQGGGGCDTC
jgi:hypothetical protein